MASPAHLGFAAMGGDREGGSPSAAGGRPRDSGGANLSLLHLPHDARHEQAAAAWIKGCAPLPGSPALLAQWLPDASRNCRSATAKRCCRVTACEPAS